MNRRGYSLEAECPDDEDDEGLSMWFAAKDGFTFAADNPIELLGLVTVYEDVQPKEDQPYWWREKTDWSRPTLGEQLLDQAIAVEEARVAEFAALRQSDPRAWEAEVRAAVAEVWDGVLNERFWVHAFYDAASTLRIPRKELRHVLEDPHFADLRG
ncbi:hypothetical protein [Catenulispora pinisilvae]|nr:hypothetical protein [Catenulispora pinisilvae]